MENITMDCFKIYTENEVRAFVKVRFGEVKIGEVVHTVTCLDNLADLAAPYVLLGIPEDIGVRANFGMAGAATTWEPALKAFLNVQSNAFLSGDEIIVLGCFEIADPADTSIEVLREKVTEIDQLVAPVVQKIIAAGKTPLIIGGGHNNVYPILAGIYRALDQPVSAVNIDAHADIRPVAEGRHSGNGFSAAMQSGFLKNYKIFGLHASYNNATTLSSIASNEFITATFFEDILVDTQKMLQLWKECLLNLKEPCALEIDLDSVQGVLASAATPSGFALNDVRKLVAFSNKRFASLHICEGVVGLADGRKDASTAKTIAYLISDFIKAQNNL